MSPPSPHSTSNNGPDRIAVAVWVAALAVVLYLLAAHTRVVTDMSAFLPEAATPRQHLLIGQLQHGPAARTIMASLENAPPSVLAGVSDRLAGRLDQSGIFSLVANGSFERNARDRNWIFEHRYLLSPGVTAERFSSDGLTRALLELRARLGTPLGDLFRPLAARDPTGELTAILERLESKNGPAMRQGVWFDGTGSKALLLLEIRETAPTVEMQETVKRSIEEAFSAAASAGTRLVLAGPAIYAVESRGLIERESLFFTLLAAALIVLLLGCVYRNLRLMILVFIPAVSGILTAVALVSLCYGSVHGITLAFAIILLAETIDYPSYLLLQASPGLPLAVAARDIWPTLRLAVLTTVIGSLAMLFSGIAGLAQLGLLAMTGVAVAGLVNRRVLPALTPVQRQTVSTAWMPPGWLQTLLSPRPWLVGAASLFSLLILAAGGFAWEDDLGALNPLPAEMKLRDHRLREELGAPDVRFMAALEAPDAEQALQRSEALRPALDELIRQKLLSGYSVAADYLPSRRTQGLRLEALPDPAVLEKYLPDAAQSAGFRPEALKPFVDEIVRARRLEPIGVDDIADPAWRLRVNSLLSRNAGGATALITLNGVSDGAALAAQADKLAPALLIDLKQEIGGLVAGYRQQVLLYCGGGLILIMALLFVHLRSAAMALRVSLPSISGILCTVAVLHLCGERFNLFHLVALLLVLGVGINYALFFNRKATDQSGENRMQFSLLVCVGTTMIGFGALAASSIPVLHSIGITSFFGTAFSFLFAAWLARVHGQPPVHRSC